VGPGDVKAAFSRFQATKAQMHANLEKARDWERQVMNQRAGVIERIARLIEPHPAAASASVKPN
jgi:hypothetical protein